MGRYGFWLEYDSVQMHFVNVSRMILFPLHNGSIVLLRKILNIACIRNIVYGYIVELKYEINYPSNDDYEELWVAVKAIMPCNLLNVFGAQLNFILTPFVKRFTVLH